MAYTFLLSKFAFQAKSLYSAAQVEFFYLNSLVIHVISDFAKVTDLFFFAFCIFSSFFCQNQCIFFVRLIIWWHNEFIRTGMTYETHIKYPNTFYMDIYLMFLKYGLWHKKKMSWLNLSKLKSLHYFVFFWKISNLSCYFKSIQLY